MPNQDIQEMLQRNTNYFAQDEDWGFILDSIAYLHKSPHIDEDVRKAFSKSYPDEPDVGFSPGPVLFDDHRTTKGDEQ